MTIYRLIYLIFFYQLIDVALLNIPLGSIITVLYFYFLTIGKSAQKEDYYAKIFIKKINKR